MKTYLDCVPCFFKQALDAARLADAKVAVQKKILEALSREILKFNMEHCPSEMGKILYALVRKTAKKDDPFKEIKRKSNILALALYPRFKTKVRKAKDSLLTAIELAITANIIDYGIKNSLNTTREIDKIFAEENRLIRNEAKGLFDYHPFKEALKRAKEVLYIADNAGEIVFDRILIEELKNKKITFVVRSNPIINDALVEDAIFCGLHKYARIISSGCDAPGTILDFCTPRFLKAYRNADLIISKGQGNFEALGDERRPIFFLFRAKCLVIAKHLGCKLGDIILKRSTPRGCGS